MVAPYAIPMIRPTKVQEGSPEVLITFTPLDIAGIRAGTIDYHQGLVCLDILQRATLVLAFASSTAKQE